MRRFLWLMLIFIIAVCVGSMIAIDPGYVLIAYSHWTIETPLWFFIVGVIVIVGVFIFVYRLVRNIRDLPHQWQAWISRRRLSKSEREAQIYQEAFNKINAQTTLKQLESTWRNLPRKLRHDSSLILGYVKALIKQRADDVAEKIARKTIHKNFNTDMVHAYGIVNSTRRDRQLSYAETWLPAHKDDPVLLLTCGRLSLRNELWGKARSYLQTSLALSPQPETYLELAKLTEKLGDEKLAKEYYRKGLELS